MADPAPPPGFVPLDQPPPGFVPISDKPQGWDAVAANALTGLQSGVGNLIRLPNTVAKLAGIPTIAPSPEDVNRFLYNASGQLTGTTPRPYTPETSAGRMGQAALSNVVPSLASGGAAGMVPRVISGMAGGAGGQAAANAYPDSTLGPLIASVASALGGGVAAQGLGAIGSQARNIFNPTAAAKQTVGRELAAAPPVPAWPGGPLVPGTPVPGSSGGGLSDLVTGLAGPVLGFAGEHLLEGAGGLGGAYIGKAVTDALHNFVGSRSANALADIRQRVANDPAFAAQLVH